MKRVSILMILLLAGFVFPAVAPGQGDVRTVGAFSEMSPGKDLPDDWESLTFDDVPSHTRYRLVTDGGRTVIRADSDGSASGLIRRITIDPEAYPIVQWRWKADNILQKGTVHEKSGDDYPARIYITFEYDPDRVDFFGKAKYETIKMVRGEYPPLAAVSYHWASNTPEGTMVPNPFTEAVMMFVVESGRENAGTWVTEERNVYEDYKTAFGEEPPMISGVALMTDTDNTGETATAYYGDIRFVGAE